MKKIALATSCLLAFSLGTPAFAQSANDGATSGADGHTGGLQHQADPASQKSRSANARDDGSADARAHTDKQNDEGDVDNDEGAEVTSGTRTVENPQTGEPENDADTAAREANR